MRRREFFTLVGGAATLPFTARAQQPGMAVVGFLGTRISSDDPQLLIAFRRGLKEVGNTEGQNLAIEYRFAENQYDRLPTLAADLVRRQVAVIVANGRAAQVAKVATATIIHGLGQTERDGPTAKTTRSILPGRRWSILL